MSVELSSKKLSRYEEVIEAINSEMRNNERKFVELAELVAEVLEAVLRGETTRDEAAKVFLRIYVSPVTKPLWLEEILAELILIDEKPEYGAPTNEELREILTKLKGFVQKA